MPVASLKSKIYVHIDHQQKGIRGAKQANIQLWQVKQYSIFFSPLSYFWKYYSTTFVLCQFVSFGIVMLIVKAEKRPTSQSGMQACCAEYCMNDHSLDVAFLLIIETMILVQRNVAAMIPKA